MEENKKKKEKIVQNLQSMSIFFPKIAYQRDLKGNFE